MKIQYTGNIKQDYTQQETSAQPQIELPSSDAQYTLIMIDPDAGKKTPTNTRPGNSDRYYLHWLVINIPANGNIAEGDVVVPYAGPTPPPNTGSHEYRFLLYKQQVSIVNGTIVKERADWSLNSFLQGKALTKVEQESLYVPPRQKLNGKK